MNQNKIEIDICQFIADMCFPLKEKKRQWLWNSLQKWLIEEEYILSKKYPIDNETTMNISTLVLSALVNGGSQDEIDKNILYWENRGWLIGYAFGYYLRAAIYYNEKNSFEDKGSIFSERKFMAVCGGIFKDKIRIEKEKSVRNIAKSIMTNTKDASSGKTPSSKKAPPVPAEKTPIEQKYLVSSNELANARNNLWSSAHIWAAFYGLDGKTPFFSDCKGLLSVGSAENWVNLVQYANSLRQFGIQFGVFEQLAPTIDKKSTYSEKAIIHYPEISNQLTIPLPTLTTEEQEQLSNYKSTKAKT